MFRSIWSDLAAARFTEAVQNEEGNAKLTQALAAADAALRIDPAYPEALFNRALILERLGIRSQARSAWKRYLSVDSSSRWAHEAEKHLQGLDGTTETFPRELDRTYAALQSDAGAPRNLVERFPQECRVWGESEILKRFAAGAAQVNQLVEQVCADGTVTAEEAKQVRNLAKSLRPHHKRERREK